MAGFTDLITFVFVSDLEASHYFYSTILRLELVVDQRNCRIYRVSSSGFLGVCERPDQITTEGLIITLVVEDVDEMHERVKTAGAEVESDPEHSEQYGIYHAFYRDPDGHLVEIQRFDDPNWNTAN